VQRTEQLVERVEVHRFMQAVVECLLHEHVVRISRGPLALSWHCASAGNTHHHVVGLHALDRGGFFLPPLTRNTTTSD